LLSFPFSFSPFFPFNLLFASVSSAACRGSLKKTSNMSKQSEEQTEQPKQDNKERTYRFGGNSLSKMEVTFLQMGMALHEKQVCAILFFCSLR
jgi:hypothetical protein